MFRGTIRTIWLFTAAGILCGCLTTGSSADSLSDTFRKLSPSVVVVKTIQRELAPPLMARSDEQFVDVAGLGSGVLVRAGAKIVVVTAAHVVQTAERVVVQTEDDRTFDARIVASSPPADVALLELDVQPADIQPAVLGDSDRMQVGDRVFVVGAPHGLSHSLSVGYIGARRRSKQMLGTLQAMEVFQTDAAINTGNSGGPMFNEKGEVVGIVSYILSRSGGFEGVGFAVTSNVARLMLLEEPSTWWGIDAYMLSGDLAKIFNVPQSAGLLVQRTSASSPAARFGLQPGAIRAEIEGQELIVGGDIILAVAGEKIEADLDSLTRIREKLREIPSNATLTLQVLRAGEVKELSGTRGRP